MIHRTKPLGPSDLKAVLKEIKGVDKMLEMLEKDKRLPGFGAFFIACIVAGDIECVNLKAMFPKLYNDLTVWISHNGISKTDGARLAIDKSSKS